MKFTVEQIDAELLGLMRSNPEFIYPDGENDRCYYSSGPEGNEKKCDGCIFGQSFQNLGVDKSELSKHGKISLIDFPFLPQHRPDYWNLIQSHQDQGLPWGELEKYIPSRD